MRLRPTKNGVSSILGQPTAVELQPLRLVAVFQAQLPNNDPALEQICLDFWPGDCSGDCWEIKIICNFNFSLATITRTITRPEIKAKSFQSWVVVG